MHEFYQFYLTASDCTELGIWLLAALSIIVAGIVLESFATAIGRFGKK